MASKRCVRRRRERVSHTVCRSQRLHIERCCLNKQPFDTFDQAEGEMLSLMGASYYDSEDLNVYLCPVTGNHYHFGHVPSQLRR